jgi:hypothetical protein
MIALENNETKFVLSEGAEAELWILRHQLQDDTQRRRGHRPQTEIVLDDTRSGRKPPHPAVTLVFYRDDGKGASPDRRGHE